MYCELQMVKQLAALVSGAVALLKMKALEFQEYNGTSDGHTYLIWKEQAKNIDEQMADEINKKNLLGCLIDREKVYMHKQTIVPDSTYDDMEFLEKRYNYPLIKNYNSIMPLFLSGFNSFVQ